jgi:hypothetical protein
VAWATGVAPGAEIVECELEAGDGCESASGDGDFLVPIEVWVAASRTGLVGVEAPECFCLMYCLCEGGTGWPQVLDWRSRSAELCRVSWPEHVGWR